MTDDHGGDDASQIAHLIDVRVRAGADDAAAIVAAVREHYGPDLIADDGLHAWVSDAMADHAAESADWPAETDCDRLDVTFASLLRHGILARPNAGPSADAALAAVAIAYAEAGGGDAGVTGFCFYDHGDLLAAAEDGELPLRFGEPHGDPDGGLHVGRTIRDALVADGFDVRWDGTLADRITITGLDWRRRRD